MLFIVIFAILAILIYLPSFWVRHVMSKHGRELVGLPGTGGELARHLIKRFELGGIKVEETESFRDCFDPQDRAVRLSPENYGGKSLTAVAVAAHEVGHAIQFYRKEKIFELRSRYLPTARVLSQIGVGIMWLFPILAIVLRSPFAVGLVIGISLVMQLLGALAYLIILPEEWDASFNKALPILIEGNYVTEDQVPKVRSVLKAAAITYFSAALANVFNVWRWLLILRR